jgi:hypothetical protein
MWDAISHVRDKGRKLALPGVAALIRFNALEWTAFGACAGLGVCSASTQASHHTLVSFTTEERVTQGCSRCVLGLCAVVPYAAMRRAAVWLSTVSCMRRLCY